MWERRAFFLIFLGAATFGVCTESKACKALFWALHVRHHASLGVGPNEIPSQAAEIFLGDPKAPTGILLIHGFSGGTDNFGDLPHALLGDQRIQPSFVHAVRLVGHGASPEELTHTRAEDWAKQIQALLDGYHDRKMILVGHSLGASLALIFASHPAVSAVVAAAPFVLEKDRPFLRRVFATAARLGLWVPTVPHQVHRDAYSFVSIPAASFGPVLDIGLLAGQARVGDKPCLVLAGGKDRICRIRSLLERLQNFPTHELHYLDGSSHQIFADSQGDLATQRVQAFVARALRD